MKLVRGFGATAQFQEGRWTIAVRGLGSKGSPLFQRSKGRRQQLAPASFLEYEPWRDRSQEQGVPATNQLALQDRDPSHATAHSPEVLDWENYASKNIRGRNKLRINKRKYKHCLSNGLKYGGVLKGKFPYCRALGQRYTNSYSLFTWNSDVCILSFHELNVAALPSFTKIWFAYQHACTHVYTDRHAFNGRNELPIFITSVSLSLLTIMIIMPWLVWLSWLGIALQSKRLPVPFPNRAHAWVLSSVPRQGTYERQPIDVSLSRWCFSPSLCPLPSL